MDNKKDIEGFDKKDYEIVLSNINLEIKQGETVGIIGEVGSGKTSLLQAILNSLILLNKDKCDGIHIAGSIGYVSQTPWIQNDTIRNNITFFKEYDEEKYQRVLEESQLKYDLNNLEDNDMTEIGEKGINLSGGQKVRVSLARALYADPDIYLLDDPISALDANIGRKIIDECIMKYLKNKTRLITTHALYFLKDLDKILFIEKGQIKWSGTYDELIYQDFFASLSKMEKQRKKSHKKSTNSNEDIIIGSDKDNEDNKQEDNESNNEEEQTNKQQIAKKLMKEEDEEIGVVKKEVYIQYCVYMGGVCFVLTVVLVMMLWFVNKGGSDLWLALWSEPENQDESKKVFFFSIYSALGVGSAIFIFFRLLMLSLGVIKLSRNLHKDMLFSLIKAPINLFHEVVPRGQLYNRLSRDIESLQYLMYTVGNALVALFSLLGAIGICSIYDLYSLIFLPFFGIIGYFLTSFYLIGKRVLSRIERTSYSPILNTVSETIPGVISIKAFGKSQEYLNRFYKGVNDNYKVNLFYYGSETWYRFLFQIFSFLFVTYLVVYTNVFEADATPQSVGLMFTYSLILQESLEGFFLFCAILETQMVSMERCLAYTTIQGEQASIMENDANHKLNLWPQEGKIEFINYSVKYRPNTEVVLKNLSFTINSKEKIGVIGRTGSGKSTICLCMFRILEPLSGTITIDDVDITKVGLDLLRQNITIIPQDPTLMQGTLRYNIDPFNTKADDEIMEILRNIGFNVNDNGNKNGDTLQKIIEEKGNNLSVGERQLVCIARAMLRKTKIILMDEATANIDMKTEEKIQNALKIVTEHSTILTIAHRIKTIVNYDRILVMDNGVVAEFDTPDNLLKNKTSLFYELYSKSAV